MFPQFRLPDGCQWPALQLRVLWSALGRRIHSEGHMDFNFKLRKLSCRVCGLLSSVSHASDRESGAKAESCFVDSSVTRSWEFVSLLLSLLVFFIFDSVFHFSWNADCMLKGARDKKPLHWHVNDFYLFVLLFLLPAKVAARLRARGRAAEHCVFGVLGGRWAGGAVGLRGCPPHRNHVALSRPRRPGRPATCCCYGSLWPAWSRLIFPASTETSLSLGKSEHPPWTVSSR